MNIAQLGLGLATPRGDMTPEVFEVPTTQAARRFAWMDAVNGVVTGPSPVHGSSAGPDINDPDLITSKPARWAMGLNDFFDYAATLNTLFTDAAGFSLILAYGSTAQIQRFSFVNGSTDGPFGAITLYYSGVHQIYLNVSSATGKEEIFTGTGGIGGPADGRHVVAFTFDRSLAFGSRLFTYLDGSLISSPGDRTTTGTDGVVAPTASTYLGRNQFGNPGFEEIRVFAAYTGALTAAEHLAISNAIREKWV